MPPCDFQQARAEMSRVLTPTLEVEQQQGPQPTYLNDGTTAAELSTVVEH